MQTAQSTSASARVDQRLPAETKPTVLLVDDDTRLRELLVLYLRGKGFEAVSAGSAREAREVVENKMVDLVVLDLDAGMQDGLELLGLIRQKYPGVRVVIFTEPNADEALMRRALAGRASGFVRKGQSLERLLFEIRLHLHVAASLS